MYLHGRWRIYLLWFNILDILRLFLWMIEHTSKVTQQYSATFHLPACRHAMYDVRTCICMSDEGCEVMRTVHVALNCCE